MRASAALIRVSGHPVRATWLGSIRPPFLACRIPCCFQGSPLVQNGPWSSRRPLLLNALGKLRRSSRVQGTQAATLQANQQAHRTCNRWEPTNSTTVDKLFKAAVCPRVYV
ncbi:hypothetical protein F5Y03DRAFT_364326 [Xylaria venustula]|nr:hypothetical protein F5Y03DRAFT_364326 [Xylaria venustula]